MRVGLDDVQGSDVGLYSLGVWGYLCDVEARCFLIIPQLTPDILTRLAHNVTVMNVFHQPFEAQRDKKTDSDDAQVHHGITPCMHRLVRWMNVHAGSLLDETREI